MAAILKSVTWVQLPFHINMEWKRSSSHVRGNDRHSTRRVPLHQKSEKTMRECGRENAVSPPGHTGSHHLINPYSIFYSILVSGVALTTWLRGRTESPPGARHRVGQQPSWTRRVPLHQKSEKTMRECGRENAVSPPGHTGSHHLINPYSIFYSILVSGVALSKVWRWRMGRPVAVYSVVCNVTYGHRHDCGDTSEGGITCMGSPVCTVQEQLAETRESRDETVLRMAQKLENARHELALTQGENEALEARLLENRHQLFDVRQLVLKVSDRLIAREKYTGDGTVEEQLAEAKRFIMSTGSQLRDGAKGTVEQARRCSRVNECEDYPLSLLLNHFLFTCRRFCYQRGVLCRALFNDERQPLNKRTVLGKPKNRSALLAYVAATGRFPQYAPPPPPAPPLPNDQTEPLHISPLRDLRYITPS
ncbi:hypothetical protein B0H10DRAFT_1960187 [Mycena sp. CBHHK59/15]|nr:hypothetical protein B0H10DRAFT_1960187 [Mycena sp. CBHHK59/15]